MKTGEIKLYGSGDIVRQNLKIIQLYESYSDTIFNITRAGSIDPKYILNFGENKLSYEERYLAGSSVNVELKDKKNKVITVLGAIFESQQNLWLRCAYKNEAFIYRFDKTKQEGFAFYYNGVQEVDISSGKPKYFLDDLLMVNNIDGGLDFFPQWSVYSDSTQLFISAKDAYEMKQTLTSEYLANREAIAPEKKAALIELVYNLEEKDDFVLMIVNLK